MDAKLQEKKVDAKDFTEALSKLQEDQKQKLLYMIEGVLLINEQEKKSA